MTARILLATSCCLLALATSVSAECAWVLWLEQTALGMIGGPAKTVEWSPAGASTSVRDCDQALKSTMKLNSQPTEGDKVEQRGSNMIFRRTDSGLTIISRWVCLPDTIDPRGPTGK